MPNRLLGSSSEASLPRFFGEAALFCSLRLLKTFFSPMGGAPWFVMHLAVEHGFVVRGLQVRFLHDLVCMWAEIDACWQ